MGFEKGKHHFEEKKKLTINYIIATEKRKKHCDFSGADEVELVIVILAINLMNI